MVAGGIGFFIKISDRVARDAKGSKGRPFRTPRATDSGRMTDTTASVLSFVGQHLGNRFRLAILPSLDVGEVV